MILEKTLIKGPGHDGYSPPSKFSGVYVPLHRAESPMSASYMHFVFSLACSRRPYLLEHTLSWVGLSALLFRFQLTNLSQGSWYSGPELFKRAGTWFICNALGTMVSGYLQSAAYTNLSGVGGMPGWKWLFIIDGIFTIPVAIIGFLVFPGIPDSPRPFFLSEDDIALAKDRARRANIRRPGRMSLDVFKRTLKRWHIWVFILCYA